HSFPTRRSSDLVPSTARPSTLRRCAPINFHSLTFRAESWLIRKTPGWDLASDISHVPTSLLPSLRTYHLTCSFPYTADTSLTWADCRASSSLTEVLLCYQETTCAKPNTIALTSAESWTTDCFPSVCCQPSTSRVKPIIRICSHRSI